MNSLIVFISHFIWISLALAVIAHGFRDCLRALQSHFGDQTLRPLMRPLGPQFPAKKINRNGASGSLIYL